MDLATDVEHLSRNLICSRSSSDLLQSLAQVRRRLWAPKRDADLLGRLLDHRPDRPVGQGRAHER
jgi:hypothetical protein